MNRIKYECKKENAAVPVKARLNFHWEMLSKNELLQGENSKWPLHCSLNWQSKTVSSPENKRLAWVSCHHLPGSIGWPFIEGDS